MSSVLTHSERRAGLGIGLDGSDDAALPHAATNVRSAQEELNTGGNSDNWLQGSGSVARPKVVCSDGFHSVQPNPSVASLRSAAAMQGLLRAEVGEGTVELDFSGSASGFREGPRIALEFMTPGGGSKAPHITTSNTPGTHTLGRHGTLLTVGGAPGRNAAELKSLLGNSSSRLKHGSTVLLPPGCADRPVVLEQAKARARVELDIALESNVCVQGGYLKGHVKIHVRERSKKELPILLADGKVRIVGFESISGGNNRYAFYHCAAPLSTISASPIGIYTSSIDDEGFSEVKEGVHVIPFALYLPLDGECNAKGVINTQSGVRLHYIAMASIKIKHTGTDHRSIAHFYRTCEVWPRLDPSVVLATASKPLQASTSKTVFMGGSGKLYLTAFLHRLHWVAGQKCHIRLAVKNQTNKSVKSVKLTLIRTTIVFKPHPHLDVNNAHAADPDACQTTTTQKEVAENTLEIGQHGAKGHASAKGWWTGVGSGKELLFSHFLLLPSDALSVTRGRLLEVEYTIRVTLGVGSFASDVQVVLPIRIINFLSIDPPPSSVLSVSEEVSFYGSYRYNRSRDTQDYGVATEACHRSRPVIDDIFPAQTDCSVDSLGRSFNSSASSSQACEGFRDSSESLDPGEYSSDSTNDDVLMDSRTLPDQDLDLLDTILGNLHVEDDSNEAVHSAISSAEEHGDYPRSFADLYLASTQENAQLPSSGSSDVLGSEPSGDKLASFSENTPRVQQSDGIGSNLNRAEKATVPSGRPVQQRGPSSFALRVQEKLHTITENRIVLPISAAADLSSCDTSTLDTRGSADMRGDLCNPEPVSDIRMNTAAHGVYDVLAGCNKATVAEPSSVVDFSAEVPASVSGVLSGILADNRGILSASTTTNTRVERFDNEAVTSRHGVSSNGSRLLPNPPVAIPVATIASTASETSAAPRPQCSRHTANTESISITRTGPGSTTGAPGGSVKARIRELEEKAKASSET